MTPLRCTVILGLGIARLAFVFFLALTAAAQVAVTTYHFDNYRTGWNASETVLTPANVGSSSFGLLATVTLDDQVDAQPLLIPNVNITAGSHQGKHDVVYVVTGNDTVYGIGATSGIVLLQRSLGTPVLWPLGCHQNGPNVGITSTPVIDITSSTLYVMAYTQGTSGPAYWLHALDLGSLADKETPQIVSGSHTLLNGMSFVFNATYERQRPGLLLANGNVYAGFGSFCDMAADVSRGWLLGWNATTLAPLSANQMLDTRATSPNTFFLSSIWMSGYGVAADPGGDLFFVTGNSDPNKDTYTGSTNIQESVVRLSPNLTTIKDLFTPCNAFNSCGSFISTGLDPQDLDYGSGGALVLPDQPGPVPHLAVAAGKVGQMFILNRDNMGKLHNPDIPSFVDIRGGAGSNTGSDCHCGPSYYEGSDKIGRVVSSGDNFLHTWKVDTTKNPALLSEATATLNPPWSQGGEDGGFFTSISSNGMNTNTQVIWALGRPTGSHNVLTLYAFNGTASGSSLPLLWTGTAGSWPNTGGNANLVPTVANGRVYVASYKALAIFGLRPLPRKGRFVPRLSPLMEALVQKAAPVPTPSGPQFWGTIRSVDGNEITIELRTGEVLRVDLTEALKNQTSITAVVGRNVVVNGTMNDKGVLEARTMLRAKGPGAWGSDSPK